MNPPPSNPNDELVEALASVEHDQWVHWSQAVSGEVPEATSAKWKSLWVDYAELTDELKEADRVWARKVVALLSRRKLLP